MHIGKLCSWNGQFLKPLSMDIRTSVARLYSKTSYKFKHGTTSWFQIGKGVHQGCILSPCSFDFYAGYIMQNSGLEEAQAGIKIARRNINNLRYAVASPYGRKQRGTKEPFNEGERGE